MTTMLFSLRFFLALVLFFSGCNAIDNSNENLGGVLNPPTSGTFLHEEAYKDLTLKNILESLDSLAKKCPIMELLSVRDLGKQYSNSLDEAGCLLPDCDIPYVKIGTDNMNAKDNPKILIVAGMHGDEPIGSLGVMAFIKFICDFYETSQYLKFFLKKRTYVLVPVANPIGYQSKEREERGFDANRDFPCGTDKFFKTATATAIYGIVQASEYAIAMSIHSGFKGFGYSLIDTGKNASSEDKNYAARIAEELSEFASSTLGANSGAARFSHGSSAELFKPAAGTFEDWMHINMATTAESQVDVQTKRTSWRGSYFPKEPATRLQSFLADKPLFPKSKVLTFVYETGPKLTSRGSYGTASSIHSQSDDDIGEVPRIVRVLLKFGEFVAPEILILPSSRFAESSKTEVKCISLFCETITHIEVNVLDDECKTIQKTVQPTVSEVLPKQKMCSSISDKKWPLLFTKFDREDPGALFSTEELTHFKIPTKAGAERVCLQVEMEAASFSPPGDTLITTTSATERKMVTVGGSYDPEASVFFKIHRVVSQKFVVARLKRHETQKDMRRGAIPRMLKGEDPNEEQDVKSVSGAFTVSGYDVQYSVELRNSQSQLYSFNYCLWGDQSLNLELDLHIHILDADQQSFKKSYLIERFKTLFTPGYMRLCRYNTVTITRSLAKEIWTSTVPRFLVYTFTTTTADKEYNIFSKIGPITREEELLPFESSNPVYCYLYTRDFEKTPAKLTLKGAEVTGKLIGDTVYTEISADIKGSIIYTPSKQTTNSTAVLTYSACSPMTSAHKYRLLQPQGTIPVSEEMKAIMSIKQPKPGTYQLFKAYDEKSTTNKSNILYQEVDFSQDYVLGICSIGTLPKRNQKTFSCPNGTTTTFSGSITTDKVYWQSTGGIDSYEITRDKSLSANVPCVSYATTTFVIGSITPSMFTIAFA